MEWSKSFSFLAPAADERVRLKRQQAANAAWSIMILLILFGGCYFFFFTEDYKKGGLLMLWMFPVGVLSMITNMRLTRIAREELTRAPSERKKAIMYFFISIPVFLAYWFFMYMYVFPDEHKKTLSDIIFYTVWMTFWLMGFTWWRTLRKYKSKER